MYSESGTDGGSLFGGGGFMPSQSAAGGGLNNNNNNDSSFSGNGRKNAQNSGLLPLTVKQLSSASQKPSDDNFYVDGQEVNYITLVGMVLNKEEKATDVSFQLDDFTGKIEVKKWIDINDPEELSNLQNLRNETYVRVHGHLRTFQGKRNFVAFSVRAIKDFNEVTFHFLECIFVHLAQSVKTPGGTAAAWTRPSAAAPIQGSPAYSVGIQNQGFRATNPYNNQYAAAPAMSAGGNSLQECQRRVQAIFEEPASMAIEMGLHKEDVAGRMVGFSKKEVFDAIDFLVNEGMIYSTIDDDHHKSASC